jgi:hypothetical protein
MLGRDADRRQSKHGVGEDGAGDAAGDLRGHVGQDIAATQPSEDRVGDGHRRVEVPAGDRAEHEDDRVEARRGRRGILEQLQAHVVGGEPLGRDARTDHERGQQRRAEELRQETAGERGAGHRRAV